MPSVHTELTLETKNQFELVDITDEVTKAVTTAGIRSGIVTVFAPHTTAGIRITQKEPLLHQDLMKALYRLVPVTENYSHDLFELRQQAAPNERSNAHAHVKAFLLGCSVTIPLHDGKLMLGQRQSVFFADFDGGRSRRYTVTIIGE